MKKYYFLFFLILTSLILNAQSNFNNNKIQGFVFNESSLPIEYANITLHRSADSSLVKANATNNKGFFEFNSVAEGSYFLKISHTNYQLYYSSLFQINSLNSELALSNIQLKSNNNNLKDVVVQSSKPLIEKKKDRFILNVDNSIINTSGTANEILEYAPGVVIDQNGQISLNGKLNVLVMIDGRTIGDNVLKTLTAANIDKIEIITNPSARYDAAGSGGIINISLKKDQKLGMNGTATISYGQGTYAKTNNSLALNYRNKNGIFTVIMFLVFGKIMKIFITLAGF